MTTGSPTTKLEPEFGLDDGKEGVPASHKISPPSCDSEACPLVSLSLFSPLSVSPLYIQTRKPKRGHLKVPPFPPSTSPSLLPSTSPPSTSPSPLILFCRRNGCPRNRPWQRNLECVVLRKGMATILLEREVVTQEELVYLNADCKRCKEEKMRGNPARYTACNRTRCCLRKIISLQPDFLAQKTKIEEVCSLFCFLFSLSL